MLRTQMSSFRRKQNRFQRETGFSNLISHVPGKTFAVLLLLAGLLTVSLPSVQAAPDFLQREDGIVVVIDPGHGGDNEGTIENGFCEKEMTLATALALYERLTQYDGITVYLTRMDDTKLSLAQRAAFAQAVEADFLFSIHYNASESHELFGSEVWVPLEAPYNAYGYQFGCTLLTSLREKGLFIRGVKTRRNDKGTDYYGIIRESSALGIPAVIIEHCHVDEVRDYPYCDSPEKLEAFGHEDADAIARFLGLSSSSLGVDFSGGPEDPFLREVYGMDTGKVVASTLIDTTAPEICVVEQVSQDYERMQATVQIAAADYDSPLMYYAYSLDGGLTYSPRQPWPGSDTLTGEYQDLFQVTLEIPEGIIPRIRVKAYNQYEATSESNILEGYGVFRRPVREEPESVEAAGTAVNPDSAGSAEASQPQGWLGEHEETASEEESGTEVRIQDFLLLSLLAAAVLVALTLVIQIVQFAVKRRSRYNRKN